MKKMILFSQAPADIQYVLSLYHNHKETHDILIIVVNVKNNFKFFHSLNLIAKIEFVPLIGQKNILKFLKYSISLKIKYKSLFSKFNNAQVYFFSNNYDYVTAYFINKLQIKNNIFFMDIYNIDGKEIISIQNNIKVKIMKYLFDIDIKFFSIAGANAYQYLFDKNKINTISIEVNPKNLHGYRYKINSNHKKRVLIFESNGVLDKSFANYQDDLTKIILKVNDKYDIYIKPHPRLGYSQFLLNYKLNIIDSYIPSELLRISDFDIVLGIDSTSIATGQHLNKLSLIDLFEFSDETRKNYLKNYLNKLSKNKLIYLDSIDGIE